MDPTIAGLGGVGVWSRELRYNSDRAAVRDAATELEELGYTSLFIPDAGGDPLGVARVEIWANDSSARLSAKLRGDWDWLAWRHR